jgi:hypothetical protein
VVTAYILSLRGRRRRPRAALRHNHFHYFASPQAADEHRAYHGDRSAVKAVPVTRATYDLLFTSRRTGIADLRNLETIEPYPLPGETLPFRRGDADGDGLVRINDPIRLLNHLFLGREGPTCPDAADADDSGDLQITDSIRTLRWLFLGGQPPPAPGPLQCGRDATPSERLGTCRYHPASCD